MSTSPMAAYPGDLLLHLESFAALLRHVRHDQRAAFERAAADLHIDRSVLRRRVQSLSAWLGTPLLQGRGRGLGPTASGARLGERAEQMIRAARELAEGVRATRERVVIACTGTVTTEILPRVLLELEGRAGRGVDLVVRRAGGALCERLVRGGDVDLGVVRADVAPAGVTSCHLADDRLWLVQHRSPRVARASREKAPSLAQMAAVPLILYGESSRTRARVMERLGPLGATIRVEVEGKAAALEYVRLGLGATFVSLLPGHRVKGARLRAVDVTRLFAASRFYVIGRRERWSDPTVSEVVRSLLRHAGRRASAD